MKPVETDEFMCRCKVADELEGSADNIARCDEVRAAATKLMEPYTGDYSLIEILLYHLGIDSITGVQVVADQWCCVSVSWAGHDGRSTAVASHFQCDEILDGLCAAKLWLEDRMAHEGVIP